MKTPALFAILSAAAMAGCAPLATPDGGPSAGTRAQACFQADQVRNFQNGAPGTVYIRARGDQVFELSAVAGCHEIDNANILGLTPWRGVSSRLCAGDWATAHLPDAGPSVVPCRVQVVKALSATEVEALPPRYRP